MAIAFPNIDPVALQIGSVQIHWYALSYLVGFLLGWQVAKYICRLDKDAHRPNSYDVDDFMTWAILAILLGGRIGYVLFYNLPHYMADPMSALKLWQGGMSFHGALIGVVIVCFLYSWIKKVSLLRLADLFAVAAPIGFFLGRIANFVNGELYGRPTDQPWGVIFPNGGDVARHPSQLYEAVLEGLVMFVLLFLMSRSERFRNIPGTISAAFLIFYGVARFLVEYVREPDAQLGLFFGSISMGQILCLPMIGGGLILLFIARVVRRRELYDRTA